MSPDVPLDHRQATTGNDECVVRFVDDSSRLGLRRAKPFAKDLDVLALTLGRYLSVSIHNISSTSPFDFATQGLWTGRIDPPNKGIGSITPAQTLKMAA
jgi:hypothetical protein